MFVTRASAVDRLNRNVIAHAALLQKPRRNHAPVNVTGMLSPPLLMAWPETDVTSGGNSEWRSKVGLGDRPEQSSNRPLRGKAQSSAKSPRHQWQIWRRDGG